MALRQKKIVPRKKVKALGRGGVADLNGRSGLSGGRLFDTQDSNAGLHNLIST